MLSSQFAPLSLLAPIILRLVLGIIFIYHGQQKLFSPAMGGPKGVAQLFFQLHIPAPLFAAYLVAIVEFFGGLLLLVGLFTPIISILLAITMVVAIATTAKSKGFSRMDATGWEYDLALLAMALALTFAGAGSISLDYLLNL